MSVGLWQTPDGARPTPQRADVAIIGAGIIGAYLALRWSQNGKQAVVLDARHVAGGATGRNGGLLLTGVAHTYADACARYGRSTAQDLWRITIRNRETMIKLATQMGTPVRRCGSYILASDERQAAELHEAAAMLQADDLPGEWHATDPLNRGFHGAISNPDDGAIQPAQLAAALIRASGAAVCEATEVYALESQDDGVLVRARGVELLADQVVLATNAWTPLLVPEFADLVVPARGQVLATAPAPIVLHQACYCDDGFEYFQQTPNGRFVLGGYRNLAIETEATYADHTTALIQSALDAFLVRHFPELRAVPIERRWSGTMGFTPDGLPLVGRLRRDDRIGFAVGFNGHGLGLGIMAAEDLLRSPAEASIFSARRIMSTAI